MKINKNLNPYSLTNVFDSFLNSWDQELRYANKLSNLEFKKNFEQNYYEDENMLNIEIILPGYSNGEIELQLDGNFLNLETKDQEDVEKNPRVRAKFKKTFQIPDQCDNSKISANLNNGILKISLPKKILPKPKVIKIN
jgi:HSP20 family molecular chaperone IbpA